MVTANITKKKTICTETKVADTYISRLRGLLGQRGLAPEEGLLIKPCRSIHTFGMKFPIDVIFITASGQVSAVLENVLPGRISKYYPEAQMVLELKAGRIREICVEIGDQIIFH